MGKIGSSHASAWMRQGLRELRAAVYPASNVGQTPEVGLYGTLTPGEVAESRRESTLDLEQESIKQESVLAARLEAAKSRESTGEDRPGPEMER